MKKTSANFYFILLGLIACVLIATIVGINYRCDPWMHYRFNGNLSSYSSIRENRFNNGVLRHLEYDSIIAGTSMTECFRPSEVDTYFGTKYCIKVPLAGGTLYDTAEMVDTALKYKPNLKIVIRSLDEYTFVQRADERKVEQETPVWLSNDLLVDDISYLLNKETFLNSLAMITGGVSSCYDRDMYLFWGDDVNYGLTKLSKIEVNSVDVLSDGQRQELSENLYENIVKSAIENPQTDFYLFFPPYSLNYYVDQYNDGEWIKWQEMRENAILELTSVPNIHLFSFWNRNDWIENLSNYRDETHFKPDINSEIIRLMSGETENYEIDSTNYKDKINDLENLISRI